MDLDTTQVVAAQTAEPAATDAAIPATPEAVVGTPATPAPPATEAANETPAAPVADDAAPAGDISIEDYNKLVEQQLEGEKPEPADEPAGEEATEAPAETAEAAEPEVTIAKDAPLDEFNEQIDAYLETVEVTPEIQTIIDRLRTENAAVAELDAVGGKENLVKFGTALTRLFETEIEPSGTIKVNAAPLITELRTAYKDEFRPIMEEGLSTDSTKYQGATLLEEIMIDSFGGEKATKMLAYAMADDPLPITPPNLLMPHGLDDSHKEAYLRLSEPKREQIQSLVDKIVELTEESKDATAWRQSEIAAELRESQGILDDEYQSIKDKQQVLNNERERTATTQRQQAEKAAEFRTRVATEYNSELFAMDDALVADLAPRLSYADADTQVAQARNITARIKNALAFGFDENGGVLADPLAERYAKQLVEEGVKFDFAKGRELLQRHYKATEKVTQLKLMNANPLFIERATRERNAIMFDIKTEQKVLVGQLASKYVKSNSAAIGKQVDEIRQKKQAVRSITSGKPETRVTRPAPKDEIAAFNAKVAKAAANGDELFEFHRG